MNAVSTLALVCGVLVGTLSAAALNPLFRSVQLGGDIRVASSQTTRAPLNGTIVSVGAHSFILETSSTAANPSKKTIEMQTDAKTLNLLRLSERDTSGTLTNGRLVYAPRDEVLRSGRYVRVYLYIAQNSSLYALSVLTPPLQ